MIPGFPAQYTKSEDLFAIPYKGGAGTKIDVKSADFPGAETRALNLQLLENIASPYHTTVTVPILIYLWIA